MTSTVLSSRQSGVNAEPGGHGAHAARALLSALAVATLACASAVTTEPHAQFEAGYPRAWTGESSAPSTFEVGRDLAVKHDGAASGYVRSLETTSVGDAYATLTQSVRADDFRGKRLQFSGFLRATNVQGAGALWLRVDGPESIPAFDNMANRRITGSGEWRLVSIVADVPADAIGISFGIVLNGSGELRADGLRFDVVDATARVTAGPIPDASAYDLAATISYYSGTPLAPANMSFEERARSASASISARAR